MTDVLLLLLGLALLVIAVEAWIWAANQISYAMDEGGIHLRHPTWRADSAIWLTSKAIFFTYIASVIWLRRFDLLEMTALTILFAVMHTKAFLHWMRLPARSAVPDV